MERLKEILISLWLNWGSVITTAIILATLCLFCSCTRTMTEYVPQYHTEYQTNVVRDTIHSTDSIYIKEFIKGDTIYKETVKFAYKCKSKLIIDTLIRTDTITLTVDNPQTLHKLSQTESELQYQRNCNLQLRVMLAVGVLLVLGMVIYQFRVPLKKVIGKIRNFICRL